MKKLRDALRDADDMDTVELMTQGHLGDLADEPADPCHRDAVARRIVEVTDEDENLVPEFILLDPPPFLRMR
jgi:hypothetical protein